MTNPIIIIALVKTIGMRFMLISFGVSNQDKIYVVYMQAPITAIPVNKNPQRSRNTVRGCLRDKM